MSELGGSTGRAVDRFGAGANRFEDIEFCAMPAFNTNAFLRAYKHARSGGIVHG
jgi:hypothetical protein